MFRIERTFDAACERELVGTVVPQQLGHPVLADAVLSRDPAVEALNNVMQQSIDCCFIVFKKAHHVVVD